MLKLAGLFILACLLLGVWGLISVARMAQELPNPEEFIDGQITQSTKIYDRAGEVLLYEIHGDQKRTVIPFSDIPQYSKEATLAIEDQNFYHHAAMDWKGTLRALITNLTTGEMSQGGSTITQQLARNTFLTAEKTIQRKIKELILANWIEEKYTKDKILELYLNQIPYGTNAYGIESASQTYFNKSAKDLSLAESATLAAMIQAPSYYSPWGTHMEELINRKNYVLEQMNKLGFIDKQEEESAQKIKLVFASQNIGIIKAPHFVMMVEDYLIQKYGEDIVEKGGLRVITTLDWKLQQIAETAVENGANRNTELYQGKNAALVAQDPKTGQILALVGSKDYFDKSVDGNFNVAVQGLRQPGSSFKPFAYVTAFEKGYSPNTVIFDLPTEFSSYTDVCRLVNINYNDENPLCFHPQNFDGDFRGPINLRNSLAQSINVASVKVLYLAGLNDTIKTAQNFGLTTINDPGRYGLSLVLGGGEVKLIDMVEAYSVFSQEGIKHNQAIILEVDSAKGDILEKYLDQATRVIDQQYPKLVNNILSDIDARAGLFQSSLNLTVFPGRDVALKTGTTNDYKDAWTLGYTPFLTIGVWAGNSDNTPMQKHAGSILAAVPIWSEFMNAALQNYPMEFFNKPDGVQENKPMMNGEYIINGQVHEILYYVDKTNPMGPQPLNPEYDSQFWNWELPLKNWRKNLPG
ncbi:PBP1A family penicillin-binding protein [Candidatus Wolfebacteria bacterium]|nr:PBP1A family penicillin-binding protein [Candidatus Wolfebacteria bacterium]